MKETLFFIAGMCTGAWIVAMIKFWSLIDNIERRCKHIVDVIGRKGQPK